MPYAADVIYYYDGTFEGLMCCVFESYEKKEVPLDIIRLTDSAAPLFAARQIKTDEARARRVISSIPQKISQEAYDFIRYAFLTCLQKKDTYILLFLRKGYCIGPAVMEMLADDIVCKLYKAVRHLQNEAHLLKGFIRFAEINHVLVAAIAPKNSVLPLLAVHFAERYPKERFAIYDETHGMALVYQSGRTAIVPADSLELPQADQIEMDYQRLWQVFHRAVEIAPRHNPKCQMSFLPKRYRGHMTEFAEIPEGISALAGQKRAGLLKGLLPEDADGV